MRIKNDYYARSFRKVITDLYDEGAEVESILEGMLNDSSIKPREYGFYEKSFGLLDSNEINMAVYKLNNGVSIAYEKNGKGKFQHLNTLKNPENYTLRNYSLGGARPKHNE